MSRWLSQIKVDKRKMKLRRHTSFLLFSCIMGLDDESMPFSKSSCWDFTKKTLPQEQERLYLFPPGCHSQHSAPSQCTRSISPGTQGRKEICSVTHPEWHRTVLSSKKIYYVPPPPSVMRILKQGSPPPRTKISWGISCQGLEGWILGQHGVLMIYQTIL